MFRKEPTKLSVLTRIFRAALLRITRQEPGAREQYTDKPWFEMARQFTDEWDQISFDPDYDTLPLSYFEPMIDRVFTRRD